MAIIVTNNRVSDAEYRVKLEERINEYFTKHTGKYEYMEVPIRSSAYHNNISPDKLFPIGVCLSLVKELKAAGFYCYWTRPSFKYSNWMDFCISKYIRTSSQGNVQEL